MGQDPGEVLEASAADDGSGDARGERGEADCELGGVEAEVSVMGYRSDRPFAEMPKLRIRFSDAGRDVFDRGEKVADKTVAVERKSKQITMAIPLATLGAPQTLLGSAKTYLGDYSMDSAPWRIIPLGG